MIAMSNGWWILPLLTLMISYILRRILFRLTADLLTFLLTTIEARKFFRRLFRIHFIAKY